MISINLDNTNEYKTRDGRKAIVDGMITSRFDHFKYYGRIIERDFEGDCPTRGTACCWSGCGWSREGCGGIHNNDIIATWASEEPKLDTSLTPKVDWNKYPEYIKFIAMDESGSWYGYTHEPDQDDACFYNDDDEPFSMSTRIDDDDAPEFDGDWEDSLCVRPGTVEEVEGKVQMDIPWEKIPEEYDVVTMDGDGTWYAYKYVPCPYDPENWKQWSRGVRKVMTKEWDTDKTLSSIGISLQKFPGDWKDSIHIRPGTNPIKDTYEGDE